MTRHRLILGSSAEDIEQKVAAYVATLPADKQSVYKSDFAFNMALSGAGADYMIKQEFNFRAQNKTFVVGQFDDILAVYKKQKQASQHPSNHILHNIEVFLRTADKTIILTAHQDNYEDLFAGEKPRVWGLIKNHVIIEDIPQKPPATSVLQKIKQAWGGFKRQP